MEKYIFCNGKDELVDFLVDRVIEVGNNGNPSTFGTVNFKVEDLPTTTEAKDMSQDELKNSYDASAGTYGITTASFFDQEGIQLVFGYYGGTEGIQAVYFDDNYEIEKDDAFDKIKNAIILLLSFEIPNLCNNFLLQIIN